MEDIAKNLSRLGVPHFFRDVIYLGWGFITLFGLNLVYKPDLGAIPNFEYSHIALNIFTVLLVSYITGRALGEVSGLFLDVVFFLFSSEKRRRIKIFGRNFLALVNHEEVSLPVRRNFILDPEIKNYIERNPAVKNFHERLAYGRLFLHLFLGFVLLFGFIFSLYLLLLVPILILLVAKDSVDDRELWKELGEAVHKEERKEKGLS